MKRYSVTRAVMEYSVAYIVAESEEQALQKAQDNGDDVSWEFLEYGHDDDLEVVSEEEFEEFEPVE